MTVRASTSATKNLLTAYQETMAQPMRFFSGFFQTPPQNFHNTEEVEIDIMRSDEEVSIVLEDLSTGYRMNEADKFTTKAFKPPVHKEAVSLNGFDLLKRDFGDNPFESRSFQAKAIGRAFNRFAKIEAKIRRSIELQASQVMQTGAVTLTDYNGNALYSLNYNPKSSHFPTAGTAWGASGANISGDIMGLAGVIRNDGLQDPDQLIFGEDAFEEFIKDEDIQKRFDNRRIDLGTISPFEIRGNGGQFRGVVEIGNYRFDVWTYNGKYTDPVTGNATPYMDPAKVVVRASGGRLDGTFGAIPRIAAPDSRVLPFMPPSLPNSEGGMILWTNAWLTPDGEQLMVGAGTRPLMVPTAIDTFGCLNTGL